MSALRGHNAMLPPPPVATPQEALVAVQEAYDFIAQPKSCKVLKDGRMRWVKETRQGEYNRLTESLRRALRLLRTQAATQGDGGDHG